MRRTPSLHITEETLTQVLRRIIEDDNSVRYVPEILAKDILVAAKHHSINSRSISITNKAQEKAIERVFKSGLSEAHLFNRTLAMVRKTLKHRGITPIKEGDRNWGMIKDATALAITFCNDFGLEPKTGIQEYIRLGIAKMSKFSLNRFPMIHEGICMDYEATLLIHNDSHRDETLAMHTYYCEILLVRTGLPESYLQTPHKYLCFVKATDLCLERGIKVTDYVDAQFEGLAWTSNPPDPGQLIGENALRRFTKYAFAKSLKFGRAKKPEVSKDKLSAFINKYRNELQNDSD
jgi:hypothetical protein